MSIRWYLTHHSTTWSRPHLDVTAMTSERVALTLNWTSRKPKKTLRLRTCRGLSQRYYPNYDIVGASQIHSPEGNFHQFRIPDWRNCQRRYWFFTATFGGKPTKSVSAIFSARANFPPI